MTPALSEPSIVLELQRVDIPSPVDPESAVVRAVDWRVAEGEAWLLAGPAGSGKSSVLAVAAGLVRPSCGCQKVFGRELTCLTEREQAEQWGRLGVVFGGGGRLLPGLTVAENLALPLRYHERGSEREIGGRIAEVLADLGLARQAERDSRDLPRRLAQRVALARALVLRPEVLLIDDPVSGLVPHEATWWVECAWNTAARHGVKTFIVASQDPRPWRDRTGRTAVVAEREWRVLEDEALADEWLRPATTD